MLHHLVSQYKERTSHSHCQLRQGRLLRLKNTSSCLSPFNDRVGPHLPNCCAIWCQTALREISAIRWHSWALARPWSDLLIGCQSQVGLGRGLL